MRKLDFLIPMYNEGEAVVKPLLDSIAIQQSVDFHDVGAIICCDGGSTALSKEFIKRYPFEIEFYQCEHQGVSATRNECLDRSKADYVMFSDCDDLLCHACGLYIIFQEMQRDDGFDTLSSCFIEETRMPNDRSKIIYINHDMDSTFVHGKVHRRAYLMEKGIRFNPKLTIHEDSYFNILAQNLTKNAKYCQTPFYLWKWRNESVCRHDKDYILKTYNNMLDSNDSLVDEFSRRGHDDKANFYAGFMIFDAYYTMNKKEWIDKTNKAYRDAVEKRFADYFDKHQKRWKTLTEQEKMSISNGIRSRAVHEGMPMESITIDQWLKHVRKIKREASK